MSMPALNIMILKMTQPMNINLFLTHGKYFLYK